MASTIKVDQIQLSDGSTPTAGDLGIDTSGTVLQVVSEKWSTPTTFNNTSVNAWMQATITPVSSTSTFLITFHSWLMPSSELYGVTYLYKDGVRDSLLNSATNCGVNLGSIAGGVTGFGMDSNNAQNEGVSVHFSIEDTASHTTTPITYSVRGQTGHSTYANYTVNGGNSSGWHRTGISTLTITEISA